MIFKNFFLLRHASSKKQGWFNQILRVKGINQVANESNIVARMHPPEDVQQS